MDVLFSLFAEKVLEYATCTWCYQEFLAVFPYTTQLYMWEERGQNFLDFYRALDPANKIKMINRIEAVTKTL